MASFLDHALALAGFGYRVFPLAEGKKTPALPVSWKRIATSDPDAVRSLWTRGGTCPPFDYNIGIATGDGLVVLDVDVKDGTSIEQRIMVLELMYGDLPNTYTVETASGGRHYYFKTDKPIGNSVGKLLTGVDVRADGGYVVAEGSRIGGSAYVGSIRPESGTEVGAEDIGGQRPGPARLPKALATALENGKERQRAHRPDGPLGQGSSDVALDTPLAIKRAQEYLSRAEPAIEGAGGDNHTIATINRALDFGLSQTATVDAMLDWNDRCTPPWDISDLRYKVASAWKSRQKPVGVDSPEAVFEPVEVEDRRTKPARGKLYYERYRDVVFSTDSVSLIDGWYDRGAMVVTYGESGSGKTHIVLGQAVAIATGAKWCECDTTSGLVVYVAAEGGRGIRKRIVAWRKKLGEPDIALALVPCPIDLMRPSGDTKALIELIKAAEDEFGQRCVMVVIDTASRALAGGNENAPDDMGAFVMHCDRIREATKATIHVIHHSGKNKAAGARGHSLLRAATDTEIEISENRVVATKQRDMDTPKPVRFTLQSFDLGVDDRGRRVTTALPELSIETEFEARVTPAAMRMLSVLKGLEGESEKPDITDIGTRWTDWWKAAATVGIGERGKPLSRQSMVALCQQLSDSGLIKKIKPDKWVSMELSELSETVER